MAFWITPALMMFWAFPALAKPACSFQGRFQGIISDVLGQRWAQDQTSYGIALFDRRSGRSLCEEYVNPSKVIYPASTVKTLIAFAALKEVEEGRLQLDAQVEITQPNAAAECRKWNCDHYGPGARVSLDKLLWDTITISNNISTNQLIDLVGRERITHLAAAMGAPSLKIIRKVYEIQNPEPHLNERSEADAAGLVQLYREIATGRQAILRPDLRLYLIEILRHQKYHTSLNARFPPKVTFYHKTGNTSQVTGDGGFYYINNEVVAVLVGLQDFNRYRVCNQQNGCFWRRGFWSLAEIGQRSWSLIERMRSEWVSKN
jgi:beta-lactamase class A